MNARILYELAGKADRRFSPFCWRARMALAHKQLDADFIPVRFTDKRAIAFSRQGRVPVLVDGSAIVCESWPIAHYLEDTYPDRPPLFGCSIGQGLTRFVDVWAEREVFPGLVRLVLCDVLEHLEPEDATFVQSSREAQMGITFARLQAERDAYRPRFQRRLDALRATLRDSPYIGGQEPTYADYSVFGFFQWARMISPYSVLDAGDPVHSWRARILDCFDGLAAKAPGYPV